MSICGEPDGEPTKYGVAIVDVCTGMLACNSILAALNARHRTGKGQKVEVSLYETSLAMLVNVASNYLVVRPRRAAASATAIPSIVPYTTYPAADGMIARRGRQRRASSRRFAAVLGHPEWAKDPRFTSNRDRVANRDAIDGLIDEALAQRRPPRPGSTSSRRRAFRAAGSIRSPQALDDPHTAAREMVETVEHPTIGALKMLGIPFRFTDTPASVRRAPPTLGQHTDEMLKGELGLDEEAIAELRQAKVI